MMTCKVWLSVDGQHTFVATLRVGSQKAGEGGLRLPFDPLNRLSADAAPSVSKYMKIWKPKAHVNSSAISDGASCG
ncbi:hypothetical protein FHS72_001900 [Loktanella ponticola]|uniref:Uncharacterized protein n=1 Tax=Yoonia ponticola TaxID=1524255 RepID=A0A7W9EY31_9RHOB|nr:hypothetical protein [Yoonia ponticola]